MYLRKANWDECSFREYSTSNATYTFTGEITTIRPTAKWGYIATTATINKGTYMFLRYKSQDTSTVRVYFADAGGSTYHFDKVGTTNWYMWKEDISTISGTVTEIRLEYGSTGGSLQIDWIVLAGGTVFQLEVTTEDEDKDYELAVHLRPLTTDIIDPLGGGQWSRTLHILMTEQDRATVEDLMSNRNRVLIEEEGGNDGILGDITELTLSARRDKRWVGDMRVVEAERV